METVDYYESIKQEIAEVFAAARKVNPANLSLPYVTGSGRKGAYELTQAVEDMQASPKVTTALLAVLSNSDCPYVAQWVQAMQDDHFASYGYELAEIDRGRDE